MVRKTPLWEDPKTTVLNSLKAVTLMVLLTVLSGFPNRLPEAYTMPPLESAQAMPALENKTTSSESANQEATASGVYVAPFEVTLYSQPSTRSAVVQQLRWAKGTSKSVFSQTEQRPFSATHVFWFFNPQKAMALFPVVDDSVEGWVRVTCPVAPQGAAWVPLGEVKASSDSSVDPSLSLQGKALTWQDFMKSQGKAYGAYWLDGVTSLEKSLKSQPDDKAKLVPLQMMKKLKVLHVRGNWLLVEAVDFDNQRPIGWLRWRGEDGRLLMFPNYGGASVVFTPTQKPKF
jgi:hypothetical protein